MGKRPYPRGIVGTKFSDYVRELEERSTPGGLAQLNAFRERYRYSTQIRQRRVQLGLSQQQLADRTGIDQAEISRIERGVIGPTELTALKLASALGSHWELVPDDEESRAAAAER